MTNELPNLLQETSILLLEQMQLMEQQNVRIQEEEQRQQQAAEQQQSGQGEAGLPPEPQGRPEVGAAL